MDKVKQNDAENAEQQFLELVDYHWAGLKYYRFFTAVIMLVSFVWAIARGASQEPNTWFLQLSAWVHLIAVMYFLAVAYFHFLDLEVELLQEDSRLKRFRTAKIAKIMFEVSLPVSFIVMIVYWSTEFPDESITGTGQDLILSVFTHFVV